MNPIAEEIASYLGSSEMTDEEFLEHYGMPRRSGRYPWGSGENPYQHGCDFMTRVENLRKTGWKETPENIQKEFGLTYSQYRKEKSIAKDERQIYRIATARSLQKDGLNTSEIGRKMGVNESTIRGWFKQDEEGKIYQTRELAKFLKKEVDQKKMIDIGKNAEKDDVFKGVSREKLDTAIYMLEKEGYHRYGGRVPQPTNPGQKTTLAVLAAPGVKNKDIFEYDKIHTINDYVTKDNGNTFEKRFTYPSSMNSKRLQIVYAEDGGKLKDGIVELRRDVPDLDLRGSRYSQVRILVDGTHYIKGMAVYADNLPDGIDVRFNTNKSRGTPMGKVLKEIKNDPDNPFGSAIKDVDLGGQYWYTDKNGKRKLGLINKRADEGDWTEWKDTLPSQFLSKQSEFMARKQLNLAVVDKQAEYDTITSLNNPTIKKYYLEKFASNCDAAAVDLKAASLPGQKYHVIIPNNSLKDTEVYAPGYKDGTKLALIRYPHGGTFEIPICTVNNKNKIGRELIGTSSMDAICINSRVAERLSGADFDGDTVMCIPTHDKQNKVKINSRDELQGLKDFDNKLSYGTKEVVDGKGHKHYVNRYGKEISVMKNTNVQMGEISNLISDMTLKGADDDELARAVRHSMVVIDAEKHKLDYKQSYIENNIAALKKKYQPKYNEKGELVGAGGAFTIISKAKGQVRVPKREGFPKTNIKGADWYDPSKPEGALIYKTASDKKLYYADGTYNKITRKKTMITKDGKSITYDMDNKSDREKYDPVMKKNAILPNGKKVAYNISTKDGQDRYDRAIKNGAKEGEVFFTSKDGKIMYKTEKRTQNSTKMAEATDAYDLVSPRKYIMEKIYADHANKMKAMANQARIEIIKTGNLKYDPNAAKVYAKEVASLETKLNEAEKNSIKERTATRLASAEINRKKAINPDLKGEDLRKLSQQLMSKYRQEVGSIPRRKRAMNIEDREWEAIQAGAITENKLKKILNNSNPDVLKERAMPRDKNILSQAQITRIKMLDNSNFTLQQIAEKMNLSTSTISKYLKGAK